MRTILNYLGHVLELFSLFLVIPLIFALFVNENISFFLIAIIISFSTGFFFRKIAKEMNDISDKIFAFTTLTLAEGFMIAALSFILLSAVAMIPYFEIMEGSISSVIVDSYFEGVSGITTTGLSAITDVTTIPKSIQLWRSLTQWIGGIGIVVVFLFIVYKIRSDSSLSDQNIGSSLRLFQSTISTNTEPNVTKIMSHVIAIYGGYTIIGIIALIIAGLPVFEAINVSFAALSTGGFIMTDAFNDSAAVVFVTIVLMIIGAISFIVHDRIFRLRFREFFMDIELRYFIGVASAFVILGLFISPNFKVLVFHVVSALSTTGFSFSSIPALHPALIFIIILSMVIGGSTCSTSGGIKQYRLAVIIRSITWNVKKMGNPLTAVIPFKLNKKTTLENESILLIHILLSSFIITILTGSLIFMYIGYPMLDAFFQVISALCTVGLSTVEIHLIPGLGKGVLIICMILGRLEVFPLLILARRLIKND